MTTPDAVYRAIRQRISDSLVTAGVCADIHVSVVTEESTDLNSPFFVQIRAAGGAMGTPRVGNQLVDDRIEVTTWVRKNLDAGGKETYGLSGENTSLMAMLDGVRSPLRNTFLGGLLKAPLRQTAHGTPTRDPNANNFLKCKDVWAASYELDTALVQMVLDGNAPTTFASTTSGSVAESIGVTRIEISGGRANTTFEDAWQGGVASTTFTNTLDGGTALLGSAYIWALVPSSVGEVQFWSDVGAVTFYSDLNLPPSGTTCTTVTVDGIVYRQWRSPYATRALSATYRVRGA